ncbi:UNVERIFIED_CONTAM: hypothetical protein Sindi_2051800, partial [Sesamum indicum]
MSHSMLIFLSARGASVDGSFVIVLLLGKSSHLLWTASHMVLFPPHCGRHL